MSGAHVDLPPPPVRVTPYTCFRCGQPTGWTEIVPTRTAGGWAVGTYSGCTTCDAMGDG